MYGVGLNTGDAITLRDVIRNAGTRFRDMRGINLIPFASISYYFRYMAARRFLINIVGNVAVFVPFGFFPPLLWRRWRNPWRVLAHGAAVPALIEFLQIFNGRSVDVDDIILNFIGVAAGYLLYRLLRKRYAG